MSRPVLRLALLAMPALLPLAAAGCTGKIGTNDPLPGSSSVQNATPTIAYATVRLTNTQYQNTVQDLFPGVSVPAALPLPNENVIDGYNNAASGQTPTSLL